MADELNNQKEEETKPEENLSSGASANEDMSSEALAKEALRKGLDGESFDGEPLRTVEPLSRTAQDENELSKCKKERDEYLDGWQRARAEFVNYKKDEIKRFETLAKFANESIIRDLINILDSFDLAIPTLEREGKAEKGIYLIRAQLEDALRNYGLERVIVSVGSPFDPAMQEAVAAVESDKLSGTVVEEIERGYMLNGKLIRPARVKVAK